MGSGASRPSSEVALADAIAAQERDVDAVEGACGRTVLHSAVLAGDVAAVRFLVQHGAGSVHDGAGLPPLWHALQHKDADVRGELEHALGTHAAATLAAVEASVQGYLAGTAHTIQHTTHNADSSSDAPNTGFDTDPAALRHTDGRKVAWLRKADGEVERTSGTDLLRWFRDLPRLDPPLGYTDEHIRHMEAGFRVVCARLLKDIAARREAAETTGHVAVEDWMAARDPFELLLAGFLFTSDCVEYVMDDAGAVVCDADGTPEIAKSADGKLRYLQLTDRTLLDHHGSAAASQSLALYATMNSAMRAIGLSPAVKQWTGDGIQNVFDISPAPPQLYVIETFAPLIRGLQRLIASRRKQVRTVFRGINVNISSQYTVGTHVVWNCFTSTTLKSAVAKSFMYGKGGTFFVVVAKEGAADVKFSSVYAGEEELLYTANIEYRVQWKLSPTLLRMMGLRFDVIVMQEVGTGETTAAEQVTALQQVLGHTVAFFADYLAQYVEGRVGDEPHTKEKDSRQLMAEVKAWLTRCTQSPRGDEGAPARGHYGALCVVGEGGSGKTSAAIAILSELATGQSVPPDEEPPTDAHTSSTDGDDRNRSDACSVDVKRKPYFPVFVALPTVKRSLLEHGGLGRFVLDSFALREADRAYLAETYEVVMVLDSLDEVGLTQEEVRALVDEGGLLGRHPWVEAHCSVVVTVRGEYLKSVGAVPSGVCGAGVHAVHMQPFTEADARTYITSANLAWKGTADRPVFVREDDVEGLVLLRNPFALHMACHAQCSGKASEDVIYETYLQMCTEGEMGASASADVNVEDVLRAGELVACRMLETNEWQGTVGVAMQRLGEQYGVSEDVRGACFRCLPFRIEDFGEEKSAFTFRHKSLGEYLAARRLARDTTGTLALVQRSFSKDSQRVLGFFAALMHKDAAVRERAKGELLDAVRQTRDAGESTAQTGSNAAALLARARITVHKADLGGVHIQQCDLRGALFVDTSLRAATFAHCWLEHIEFHDCDMHATAFPDCSLGTLLPPLRHSRTVTCVTVSSDGAHIVSGCADKIVRVWDMTTGALRSSLEGHTLCVNGVAASAAHVVSCASDTTARVWDLATGTETHLLAGHTAVVRCVTITPTGSHAISGSDDGTVRVWDIATGEQTHLFEGHGPVMGMVFGVAVSPDSAYVASCATNNNACLWDIHTGEKTLALDGHGPFTGRVGHSRPIRGVAFTPDGKHIVTCSDDQTLRIWDLHGREVLVLLGHSSAVFGVAVSPDGHLLSCSLDNSVRCWDAASGEQMFALEGHSSRVRGVAVHPDGSRVVSCSEDRTVRVWKMAVDKDALPSGGHNAAVHGVAAAADGARIVSCSRDNSVRVWDARSGCEVRKLLGHTHPVLAVAITPCGTYAVSGSHDKTICIWDIKSGSAMGEKLWHGCMVNSVVLRVGKPIDGLETGGRLGEVEGYILSTARSGQVYLWDIASCMAGERYVKALRTYGPEDTFPPSSNVSVNCAIFTPDGTHIVSGSDDTMIVVWDTAACTQTATLAGHTLPVRGLAITDDGSRVVSCSNDKTVRVWELATGTELLCTEEASSPVCGVALTPGSTHILSYGGDKTLCVRDLYTGKELHTIRGHCASVTAAVVTQDGSRIVSCSDDTTVRVWGVDGTWCAKGADLAFRCERIIGTGDTVPVAYNCAAGEVVPELAQRILFGGTSAD